MNLKKILIYPLIITFLNSCGDKHDFEQYVNDIGIDLVDEYRIDSIQQSGFTDWTLKAVIAISNNDKKRILETLKRTTNFKKVGSEKEYFEKYHTRNDSIVGFIK